ncbi:MAG TPA: class I SAM-dependent methyltransferase [Terriglobales bacterium]|nr:class I SAM-dependent methyltransferase [Terriglobales bacterium]
MYSYGLRILSRAPLVLHVKLVSMPAVDPTQRFSARVDNYARYRPGYPPELLNVLRKECGLQSTSVIADIGSGTGLLSKLFLENGNPVFGVEPNKEMREAGERFLQIFSNFVSIAGTAEATTLSDHAIDFVTAAQAAHWFDRDQARREFIRILKPGGWTVLLWNERRTQSTPFLDAYERLLLKYGTDYQQVRHERTTDTIDFFFAPSPFQAHVFDSIQEFDYPGLEGRLMSSSYAPLPSHPNYAPMLDELHRIFDAHQVNGRVGMEYKTRMYYGQLA